MVPGQAVALGTSGDAPVVFVSVVAGRPTRTRTQTGGARAHEWVRLGRWRLLTWSWSEVGSWSILAYALAAEGVGVSVLEATTEYEDRVRGESMHAWGMKEARNLGVEAVLLDAGAHIAPLWKQYIEGSAKPARSRWR